MGLHRLRTVVVAGLVLVPPLVLAAGVESGPSRAACPARTFTHAFEPFTSPAPR